MSVEKYERHVKNTAVKRMKTVTPPFHISQNQTYRYFGYFLSSTYLPLHVLKAMLDPSKHVSSFVSLPEELL